MYFRNDHFHWQEANTARSIKNIGNSRVEFVEFDFK